MRDRYQVAIIGGSIAGASLAIRLGREGVRTLVVEKTTFPRRKACGEGLSDIAISKLFELGVGAQVLQQPHRPFYGYRAHFGEGHVDIAFREPTCGKTRGIGIQRSVLDQVLANELKQFENVDCVWGEKATRVEKMERGYTVQCEGRQIETEYLVLADGANSVFASRLGVQCRRRKSSIWGISWLLEGEFTRTTDRVHIIVKDGYELYCTPVSVNRVNACFLARKDRVSQLSDSASALSEIQQDLRKLHFSGSPVDKPIGIGPLGSTWRPSSHEHILLVGDALECLDPISGMGMTHGLISSQLAGEALQAIFHDNESPQRALSRYAKQRTVAVRRIRGFTRVTAALLRRSRTHRQILELLSKTNLPEKTREVLRVNSLDSSMPGNLPEALLLLAGLKA